LEQRLKHPNLRQLRQRLTLRAKTHPLTAEESRSYIHQRLRIAGSNGQQIFEPEALAAIHRYSGGIPRVVNLLCEHCLVSAFVDQHKTVTAVVVDAVARDFDLESKYNVGTASQVVPDKFDLMDALKTISNLTERLKESHRENSEGSEVSEVSKEGKL
jgi:hypothetical protein